MTTSTFVQPYLFFGGRCEEALEFYQTALGAEIVTLMRYNDSPEPHPSGMLPEGYETKVMYSAFRVGGSPLMASDGCGGPASFEGFTLSLTLPDDAACQRAFSALADGGEVRMPLGKTFWSPCFGMVADRFGLGWMITVPG
ncbi:MAG: VOC family protein [Luteolibacter sp.]